MPEVYVVKRTIDGEKRHIFLENSKDFRVSGGTAFAVDAREERRSL
jgi:hypothetical protein